MTNNRTPKVPSQGTLCICEPERELSPVTPTSPPEALSSFLQQTHMPPHDLGKSWSVSGAENRWTTWSPQARLLSCSRICTALALPLLLRGAAVAGQSRMPPGAGKNWGRAVLQSHAGETESSALRQGECQAP